MAALEACQGTRRRTTARMGTLRPSCTAPASPCTAARLAPQALGQRMAPCLVATGLRIYVLSPHLPTGVPTLHGVSVAGAGAQPRGPTFLFCRVLACWHAPWPPSHRILVFLLPHVQLWNPMELRYAGRCLLRRLWRSARPVTGRALGFFCDALTLVLVLWLLATVLVIVRSVSPLAPFPPCPPGQSGGAPLIARATASPAVLASRTMDLAAGTPEYVIPVAPSSPRACVQPSHGVTPMAIAATLSAECARRPRPFVAKKAWLGNARLSARGATMFTCLRASAQASSQRGAGGGGMRRQELKEAGVTS